MESKRRPSPVACIAVAVSGALAGSAVHAQTTPRQVVKPPISQAWIDVATFSGFGMGGMGM